MTCSKCKKNPITGMGYLCSKCLDEESKIRGYTVCPDCNGNLNRTWFIDSNGEKQGILCSIMHRNLEDYSVVTGISGKQYKISKTPPFKPYKSDEDWSLKDKSFTILEQCGLEEIGSDEDIAYSKIDIETLRKKLIERLCSVFDEGKEPHIVESIVNKLFGVEE